MSAERVRIHRLRELRDALLVFAAYLLLARVLTWAAYESGWPDNHERQAMFERVEMFRRAFLAGDLLPVWSPFSHSGHGSPLPLFYHRLFTSTAAVLALAVGSYAATKALITAVLALGCAGMHHAARTLGLASPYRWASGALFAGVPYVLTEWLTRGAVAEFFAMAIVPFLLAAMIRFARGERVGWSLGLWAAALFHAHSVICFFSLPLLVVAGAIAFVVADDRMDQLTRALVAAAQFAVVFLALTGPLLVAIYVTRRFFTFEVLEALNPTHTYVPMIRYLVDPYEWGQDVQSFSVEIGRWLVLLFVFVATAALITRAKVINRATTFLVVTLLFSLALQHPSSAPFYRAVPGALMLQFPWRMLVFIVPSVILLCVSLAASTINVTPRAREPIAAAFVVVVAVQLLASLDMQKIATARLNEQQVKQMLTALDGPNYPEYLPANVSFPPPARAFVTLTGCGTVGNAPLPETRHFARVDVDIDAQGACTVEFNQFCTPLIEVTTSRGRVSCMPGAFPVVVVPAGGPARVSIVRRNLLSLLLNEWRQRRQRAALLAKH